MPCKDCALRLVTDNTDQEYWDLCHYTQIARPQPSRLDSFSAIHYGIRVEDGIRLHSTRLVIPKPARTTVEYWNCYTPLIRALTKRRNWQDNFMSGQACKMMHEYGLSVEKHVSVVSRHFLRSKIFLKLQIFQ